MCDWECTRVLWCLSCMIHRESWYPETGSIIVLAFCFFFGLNLGQKQVFAGRNPTLCIQAQKWRSAQHLSILCLVVSVSGKTYNDTNKTSVSKKEGFSVNLQKVTVLSFQLIEEKTLPWRCQLWSEKWYSVAWFPGNNHKGKHNGNKLNARNLKFKLAYSDNSCFHFAILNFTNNNELKLNVHTAAAVFCSRRCINSCLFRRNVGTGELAHMPELYFISSRNRIDALMKH